MRVESGRGDFNGGKRSGVDGDQRENFSEVDDSTNAAAVLQKHKDKMLDNLHKR